MYTHDPLQVRRRCGNGPDLSVVGLRAAYRSSKNSPIRDFIRPSCSFRVSQISTAVVGAAELALFASPSPDASRAAAQVGRFTVDDVDAVPEGSGLRLFVLRLLLLVSVVWQE